MTELGIAFLLAGLVILPLVYVLAQAGILLLGERYILRTSLGVEPAMQAWLNIWLLGLTSHVFFVGLLIFTGAVSGLLRLEIPGVAPYFGALILLLIVNLGMLVGHMLLISDAYKSGLSRSLLVGLAPALINILCFNGLWIWLSSLLGD